MGVQAGLVERAVGISDADGNFEVSGLCPGEVEVGGEIDARIERGSVAIEAGKFAEVVVTRR